ncbi:hypothetical protein DAEQUDRAFT_796522 [Daedalea quercina L-15889]|uniref:DUF7137 domain-containing protein n=1 Tax=Daedalea quercina L-15889 TaxID=1314783 RepID=A0A165N654_9APHY|nr:hypothetical protein DAEQUDRAFT_796522 [Daedalea quercina L-15889]
MSSASSSAASSSSVSIPATAAAGGLTITKPPQTATSYYKIAPSNNITFAWNFTSLLVTPTSLTVSAVCENGNTYPVGPTDGIIPGTATQVVWDLWSWNEANPATPLAVETYTLEIWGDLGRDAVATGGQLSSNMDLQFALYSPASYTPLSSWTCAGCNVNGALSDYVAHPAFASLVVTFVVMFLSGYTLLRQAFH